MKVNVTKEAKQTNHDHELSAFLLKPAMTNQQMIWFTWMQCDLLLRRILSRNSIKFLSRQVASSFRQWCRSKKIALKLQVVYTRDIEVATQSATKIACVNWRKRSVTYYGHLVWLDKKKVTRNTYTFACHFKLLSVKPGSTQSAVSRNQTFWRKTCFGILCRKH